MSAKENDMKALSSSSVRSKGLLTGKCQRVEICNESPAEPEVRPTTQQRKVSASELLELIDETPLVGSTSQKTKKANLSKYIDDKLLNFDPLAKRKERTSTCSSGENTTHSTGSNGSKGEKITETSLSAAVKNKENISKPKVATSPAKPAPAETASHPSNIETPNKRSRSKVSTSKFSVDAVDSPQGAAPAVPAVSALASAMARSSTLLARSSKKVIVPASTSVEEPALKVSSSRPIATVTKPVIAAIPAYSGPTTAPVVDLNTTSDANHTATNTHAPTLAFKSTAEEASRVDPMAAEAAAVAGAMELSKPKRVSFIAPSVQVQMQPNENAVAPETSAAITPKNGSSSQNAGSSSHRAAPSSEGRIRAPSAPAASAATSNTQVATTHPAGILSDPSRFIELNGRQFIRLNVLGKGGSSCVYRIIGADDGQVYAYKRVEVRDSEDMDAVFDSYANEIALLRRLSAAHSTPEVAPTAESTVVSAAHPSQSRIIELVDFEVRRDQRYIAMVLEAGDIDLAKVLTQKNTRPASTASNSVEGMPKALLDPFFARMVWREMLEAVDHIHQHRIVHGDLKPANFVFVKGHLKLIDFGIAKSFNSDTTNIYRESQIGTINYMAPEAIAPMSQDEADAHPHSSQNDNDRLKMRLGRASDIWSLGCILYQMVYGRPPFAALNTIQKLSTIPNPKHVIKYADWGDADAVDSMKACLKHDARMRSKIKGPGGLLELPYLQVPHNSAEARVVEPSTSVVPVPAASQQNVAIGKEQVTCIVGAVLDSLHATAQDTAEKAQASGRTAGTRSTRSGRGNAEAEAALKLAQGIVQWIDAVDQDSLEKDVMQVVQEQDWPLANTFVVPAAAVTVAPTAQPTAEVLPPPPVLTTTTAISPGSPYIHKRKAPDTPGSVTRSASKARRTTTTTTTTTTTAVSTEEVPLSVQKSAYKPRDYSHLVSHAPTTASKTPSHNLSPRAQTMRPTFLHGLGAKIPAFPNLHAAVTATPSRVASSSSGAAGNKNRSPLKAMPMSLQQQILNSAVLRQDGHNNGGPAVDRASKWMKPPVVEDNMKSALESRLTLMRNFINSDQDNVTETNMDITGFYF